MEITLRLPTGDKIFTQNTVNFLTIKKALEWMKRFTSTQKHMIELAQAGIQGEVLEEDDYEIFDAEDDLTFTAELVVGFFNGQFTYDDFARYAYFNDVAEFYKLGQDIWTLAFEQKKDEEAKSRGKKRRQTS